MGYKFLEHTADVKILVSEKTLESAFATAAMAMKEVMAGKIKIRGKVKKEISIDGKDLGALLYNFLEEFLYLFDAKDFILSDVKELRIIKEKGKKFKLNALIVGDRASNYKFTNDVKAITYNDMQIKTSGGKFIIQFVLDV